MTQKTVTVTALPSCKRSRRTQLASLKAFATKALSRISKHVQLKKAKLVFQLHMLVCTSKDVCA
jgi:hypothetical protein